MSTTLTTEHAALAFAPPDEAGVTRIAMPGALIVPNRQQFKQHILDLLAAGRRVFVCDFAGTEYVDNSGLGVLISASKKIREAGGELVLEGLNEDVLTLFQLTKLDTLFTIRPGRPAEVPAP